jgi:hypothetical protein
MPNECVVGINRDLTNVSPRSHTNNGMSRISPEFLGKRHRVVGVVKCG